MPFKIIITKEATITKTVRGNRVTLGPVPVTKEDFSKWAFSNEKFESPLKPDCGYAPDRKKESRRFASIII